MARIFLTLTFALILSGCSLFERNVIDFDTNREGTAEEIYARANELRGRGRYNQAELLFGEVERQFPLSPLAIDAQFDRAMTLYEGQKYAEAIVAFDRFLRFNPGEPRLAAAMLGRANSYYDEIPDVFRDQGVTQNAKTAMLEVIERFPGSPQAAEAGSKLVLIEDQIAGHEMVVGRTYLQQGRFLAAQNRFTVVIEEHATTSQVPEAFYRLVETSLALGLRGEALRYGATLGYNYPASDWYARAYDLLTN